MKYKLTEAEEELLRDAGRDYVMDMVDPYSEEANECGNYALDIAMGMLFFDIKGKCSKEAAADLVYDGMIKALKEKKQRKIDDAVFNSGGR